MSKSKGIPFQAVSITSQSGLSVSLEVRGAPKIAMTASEVPVLVSGTATRWRVPSVSKSSFEPLSRDLYIAQTD